MKKTFSIFIKAALVLSIVLFFISFYYLLFNDSLALDPDSMLLAMLLVVFTAIASIILGIILYFIHRK